MSRAAERLENITKIERLLRELEQHGFWKFGSFKDQSALDDNKDDVLRILNLIETELERAGLWDRSIESTDEKDGEVDVMRPAGPMVTLDHIGQMARLAESCLKQHKA